MNRREYLQHQDREAQKMVDNMRRGHPPYSFGHFRDQKAYRKLTREEDMEMDRKVDEYQQVFSEGFHNFEGVHEMPAASPTDAANANNRAAGALSGDMKGARPGYPSGGRKPGNKAAYMRNV